jgi:hypothetical protein
VEEGKGVWCGADRFDQLYTIQGDISEESLPPSGVWGYFEVLGGVDLSSLRVSYVTDPKPASFDELR